VAVVREVFEREVGPPLLDSPPSLEMGDLSAAACFELAKQLRQPPRQIAQQIAARLLPIEGLERVTVAGAGYLNFHLDRGDAARKLFRLRTSPPCGPEPGVRWSALRGPTGGGPPSPRPSRRGKIVVEHTSINPNKAAHIGHLRNAVLGDTFVRLLRFRGEQVEVQNYIDNTGVQVADVVVGFVHLEKKGPQEVERLIRDPAVRFDYYCWDLYARVFQWYDAHPQGLDFRAEALEAIEEGRGALALLAGLISPTIVRAHLETMWRLNVQYDLLVQENEILRLDFWKSAFELLKKNGAIHYEDSGKNAGCWVMALGEAEAEETDREAGGEAPDQTAQGEDVKIIVRSNGTVTYVGKDIAYHLWKFALLERDFAYAPFHRYPNGQAVWRTALEGRPDAPPFGRACAAYAVIDSRQSYLQNLVKTAFHALGYHAEAENLHHFAYEVVALSPRCAEEMGIELSDEDRQRPYVEVSGRKGLGVKADDLIDALVAKALDEVCARQMTENPAEQETYARMIAVGALRYFLLKYSRRVTIAFDTKEALAFEGETGPYLQYSVVRARNIFRKFQEARPEFQPERLEHALSPNQLKQFFSGKDGLAFWEVTLLAGQLELVVEQALTSAEPAVVAKYAFRLAQAFNNFYHRYHILSEPDPLRQQFLLYLVQLVNQTLSRAVDLMGMEIPERM
jgi:arginyl-tRNA synthetase